MSKGNKQWNITEVERYPKYKWTNNKQIEMIGHKPTLIQLIAFSVPTKANFQAPQSKVQAIIVAILLLLDECIIRYCLVDNNTITMSIWSTIAAINKAFDIHGNFIGCQSEHVQSSACMANHFFFRKFCYICENNPSLEIFHCCKLLLTFRKYGEKYVNHIVVQLPTIVKFYAQIQIAKFRNNFRNFCLINFIIRFGCSKRCPPFKIKTLRGWS